ncbi:MAG: hypothetical protein MK095_04375 [Phycisphaerales bacterium]|nr:hypothetical protein [Phycisphaerales bacterium]
MWLLRILTALQDNFGLWLMCILIAEGLFAFIMMFMFPPASLAMVFLGLITLGLSIIVKMCLGWVIRILARVLRVELPAANSEAPAA